MKRVTVLLASAALIISAAWAAAQQVSQDERTTRQVIARFADTWNRQDMTSLAQLSSEGADFVVITGKHLKGRSEIEMHHAQLQKTGYKDSHLVWRPTMVRFLRADVAIAHLTKEITFNEGKEKRTSWRRWSSPSRVVSG